MPQVIAGAPSDNFFLDGNFSPIAEERDAEAMEVIGEIPADLSGHFFFLYSKFNRHFQVANHQ